jgi:translocation and assembly module TamB
LWQFAQGLAGKRIGTLSGAQVIQSTAERRWPASDSPLQGVLDAHVADLGVWGTWVPPGWRLSGVLDTHAQVTGRLKGPELQGRMLGRDLGVRNVLQGVSLAEGQLSIRLDGANARIEQLSFKGGEGRLNVTGGATLGESPQATLSLLADKFRVLGRLDRRLVASGNAQLLLNAQQLKLTGTATVDEGLFDIGRGEAPTLDSDVVVRRSAHAASAGNTTTSTTSATPAAAPLPEALRQAQVDIKIGLGEKLQLKGQGVDTALRGNLVVSSPGGRLALNGTIHTHEGHYAAYGQKLEITRGDFSFTGPLDNPRLDVLAIRPNLDVLVGVNITGTALSPHIQLYSEPEMAEYYKLSWLVMGRSPDGLGSTDVALLQRAAFALLSGNSPGPTDKLMEALGITDISVRQTEGDTRDTIIGLGKQLSRRWYVGYERGVHATTGSWQLIYRIAQRFTLRAQSGTENAIDMIWSWRW